MMRGRLEICLPFVVPFLVSLMPFVLLESWNVRQEKEIFEKEKNEWLRKAQNRADDFSAGLIPILPRASFHQMPDSPHFEFVSFGED